MARDGSDDCPDGGPERLRQRGSSGEDGSQVGVRDMPFAALVIARLDTPGGTPKQATLSAFEVFNRPKGADGVQRVIGTAVASFSWVSVRSGIRHQRRQLLDSSGQLVQLAMRIARHQQRMGLAASRDARDAKPSVPLVRSACEGAT